jgi:NADPH:quinone reductase-like Zn-dependent oxidoreductase
MRYSDFKLVEYTDLDQEKEQIIQSISGMTANNKEDAAILDRIWKILNSGQITTNIDTAFGIPLSDENMAEKQ